jgi:hypothetical protein
VAKYVPVMKYPEHSPGVLTVEPSQAWDPVTVGGVGLGRCRSPRHGIPLFCTYNTFIEPQGDSHGEH